MGNLIERVGPFNCTLIAFIFIPLAWAFACLGSYLQELPIVLALYGICLGLGCAFGYIGAVANIQRWFPDYKSLASGVVIMFLGVAAFALQLIAAALMGAPYNLAPWQVQGIFAAAFVILLSLALPFMRAPPPGFQPPPPADRKQIGCFMRGVTTIFPSRTPQSLADKPYTFLQAVMQLETVLICCIFFCFFMPGVVFLSSAADMVVYCFNYTRTYGSTISAGLNIMNFAGRIMGSMVADRIGRKSYFMVTLIVQSVALALMAVALAFNIFPLWVVAFYAVGFCYGSGHATLPPFLGDMFGSKIVGSMHGLLLFIWALADIIGIPIFQEVLQKEGKLLPSGKLVGTPYGYQLNCYWLLALPLVGFLFALFLDTSPRDRTLRKAFKECRVRMCGKVCVIKCLTPAEQDLEYAAYQEALSLHKRARAGSSSVTGGAATGLEMVPGSAGKPKVAVLSGPSTTAAGAGAGAGPSGPIMVTDKGDMDFIAIPGLLQNYMEQSKAVQRERSLSKHGSSSAGIGGSFRLRSPSNNEAAASTSAAGSGVTAAAPTAAASEASMSLLAEHAESSTAAADAALPIAGEGAGAASSASVSASAPTPIPEESPKQATPEVVVSPGAGDGAAAVAEALSPSTTSVTLVAVTTSPEDSPSTGPDAVTVEVKK